MKIIRRKRTWFIGLIFTLLLSIIAFAVIRHVWTDPGIPLLVSEGGAQWIRLHEAPQLPIRWSEPLTTHFRYCLNVEEIPKRTVLNLRAMKEATVYMDGSLIFRSPTDRQRWKESYGIDLSPWMTSGGHELQIDVLNEKGHPAFIAYCQDLDIRTGSHWEASSDGSLWLPALPVDEMPHLGFSRTFPRADRALYSLLPFFTPLFVLVFLLSYYTAKLCPDRLLKFYPSAAVVRYGLLSVWLFMAINNFWKLPLEMGMDNKGHWQYIQYVEQFWRVPLATEGWQMFQPPLFHFLEAFIYRLFIPIFNTDTVIRILKLLPLLCGALQVEICYRVMRYAYPGKESLQIIGTLLGGALPMNLYIAQSLGNEPLAGVLTALIVLCAIKGIALDTMPVRENGLVMGFLLGMALLTKVTAVLIIPPVLCLVTLIIFRKTPSPHDGIRVSVRFAMIMLGVALIVSGWYYLRNYMEMGRFFIGGWDSFRAINWWQDPGFRTPRQLCSFGEALSYPVFSSLHGFWDALYSSFWMDGFLSAYNRPPWNYRFMLSGAWLSLLPTGAMIVGGAVAIFSRNDGSQRRMLRFAISTVLLYLVAIFYLFLTVPILSSAKASYALGLIPCFVLLAARGFEVLTGPRLARAIVHGLLACWVAAAYAAYLVL